MERVAGRAGQRFGRLDGLVANAGAGAGGTRSLAAELGPAGIGVTWVNLGPVDTPRQRARHAESGSRAPDCQVHVVGRDVRAAGACA